MTIAASAVWRCRPSGATTNGAAYDGTSYPGGTDYSQQNAAQATGTLGTSTASTTFTDAGGTFTSQMVGNALRINSGAGFTVGYYFITAFGSSTSVTLDRASGTGTVASWSVGGAYGGSGSCPFFLADSSRATGNKVVPGNTIYIFGASGVVASPDYSWTGLAANPPVAGDTTSGAIKWIGEGTRPILTRTDGEIIFANGGSYQNFNNFYYKAGATSANRIFDAQDAWFFQKVTFDLNDLDISAILGACALLDCEALSKTSGAPTSRTTAVFSAGGTLNVWHVVGSNFHDLGGPVFDVVSAALMDNLFNKCVKEFVKGGSSDSRSYLLLRGNTFNNTAADAVSLSSAIAISTALIFDNIFSNNVGSGKAALKLTGTTALNDRLKMFFDYNDYYNNATNISNGSVGASDLTLDPQYASSTDFTLSGTNVQAQAYPRGTITGG